MAINFVNGEDAQKALKNEGVYVVNVFATWCGPCQMLAPILEEVSETVKVFKIDADQNKELAISMGVSGLPTTFIFKDGQAIEKMVGYTPKEAIEEAIKGQL